MKSKLTKVKKCERRGNNGITLVALVITIIIIIILSTIAINLTFGENGLITRAQQAAEMSVVSRILEQLEMAKGSAYIDGAGEIDPDHYFDILEEEGIINDKETDVVDNGDGTYDVTTEGDRVFEVTLEPNGDLDIEYVGKNDEPRISSINVTDKTENSISVEVVTKNVDNAEYTYSYKKTDEGEEAWQEAGTNNTNTFTYSGLENNTSYDIKVTVKTGDTTIEKTITVQLGTGVVEIPDNTIIFGQAAWQGDGTASMEISTTESGYTLQYQIGGTSGEWTTITSGQSITGLKHGDTVYAKITDGVNDSEIQQTTIEDKGVPEVSVTSTGNTSNSISVSVSATDKESGMSDSVTYTYSIKQSGSADYSVEATDIIQNTYTFNNLQSGISYDIKVEVKADKAGNTGTGYLAGQTTTDIPGGEDLLEDGTIIVTDPAWSDGKASIDISTDSEYSIEYQINGTSDGSWINIGNSGTVPNLNYGDTVNIRLTDGTNHGDFVTVTIGDEIAPTVNVTLGTSTSNSISVNVVATDNESGMTASPLYTYYIKENTEPDSSYTAPEGATEISANTYTFANLKQNTSYDIKVEVKADIAGNMGTGTLLNQTTSSIPGGDSILEDGTLTIGEPKWSGGKASIEVSTNQSYQIEYQVNGTEDGSWTTVSEGTISNLNHGDKVNIRLTDGQNAGGYVTKEIKDEVAPKVTVTSGGVPTSNSIAVSVAASDNESGMASSLTYTYYIKQSNQGDESYQAPSGATGITQNTYTFTGLQQGTSYDVKVEVTGDVAGNIGSGILLNQTTQSIPGGSEGVTEGAITFGAVSWSAGQASITVSTNTSYQIEYKLSNPEVDEGWTSIDNEGIIPGLSHGNTVYARLTDGNNHGDYATASIQDGIDPVVDVLASGSPTSNSISVSVTAQDNESGMSASPTYTYYIKQSSEEDSAYKTQSNSANLSTNTYTFTGLTQGTGYDIKVDVTGDNAGNTGTGYLARQTTASIPDASGPDIEEGAITFGTVSWSSNKASISVSTNTSYQIEYQVGAITENNWTGIANNGTISNLNYGDTVYARLTDGVNHGEYASASIDDGIEPEASIEATEVTSDSITVKVTASDGQSGLATSETYKYYLDSEGSPRETSTSDTYKYEGLNAETGYTLKVVVTDVAGNEKETTVQATTDVMPELFSDIYDTTTEYTDSEGNKAIIPGGYAVGVTDDINKINEGLVITDKIDENHESTGNQFVWIPVDDISQIANQTSGTDANGRQNYQGKLYDFSTTGATEKSNYGQGTRSYREPDIVTGSNDTSYDGSSRYLSILGLSSSSEFKTQLQEEFNEMIESVDTYGGFYIGRYETGNLASNTDTVPVVVKGNNSISDVNWYYMYQNSKLIGANSNVVSTMIWGSMWDRALIWLTETGDKTYSDLMNSSSWGNYSNSTGAAATNSGGKQPTGTNDAWQANNIYDLAGNVYDWTIEAYNTYDRVNRGGYYDNAGSGVPASYRGKYSPSFTSTYGLSGSRSALFVALNSD